MDLGQLPLGALLLAVPAAAYLLGHWRAARTERERRRKICSQVYDVARWQQETSQDIEAALTAAEAIGHDGRHECYSLVAGVLDDLDRLDAAADYWSRARSAARAQSRDSQAYYYYREARSLLRARNAEFSYLRSKAAIELIELGHFSSRVGDHDYLQQLRAIRMLSSLQHFKGTEAWNMAVADAVWLQRNATDKALSGLGASVSAAHLAGELTADMIGVI